ncbi:acyl-CoA thioesterase [Enterococcus rivorum]|uniref:Acyl-CoA thioesterase n=1 Tax=Enterococcus rivorum TaxID=762845 RepID=A0A1E5KY61_9ENTE|nr:acyl-CoA thioesterase [Enterococcus rivorum]MBP2099944.1 acyl-CoA hydrolase [Enterococcus rivorum]OEH82840.1 acyl-CoA thioesterase [Enterococcus rivorum]
MKCSETRAIQTHIVTYPYLNFHETLFGGQLMAWLDETAGISATRLAREAIFTASVDHLDFLAPLRANHSACIDAFVSGVGTRSMEVFAKVIGEDLFTGERYLAGTCFMTFVVPSKQHLPAVEPETEEERFVCEGYEKRKQIRLSKRQESIEFANKIATDIPWT